MLEYQAKKKKTMVIKPITNKEAFYLYVCLYVPVREKTIQNKQNKQQQEIYLRDSPERCQDQYRGENLKKKKNRTVKNQFDVQYVYVSTHGNGCMYGEREIEGDRGVSEPRKHMEQNLHSEPRERETRRGRERERSQCAPEAHGTKHTQ
jgi:hypothetical protein